VDFIEAVGNEADRVVPLVGQLLLGVLLTMTLVFLHLFVSKFWKQSKKEAMKECGETPEGNVSEVAMTSAGLPSMPWISQDLLVFKGANYADAEKICETWINTEGKSLIHRIADTADSYVFRVGSQTAKKIYTVRLSKDCMFRQLVGPIRDVVSCTCPGHSIALGREGLDKICKHSLAILMMCRFANVASTSLPTLAVTNVAGPSSSSRYSWNDTWTCGGSSQRRTDGPKTRASVPSKVCAYSHAGKATERRSKGRTLAIEDTQYQEPRLEPVLDANSEGRKVVRSDSDDLWLADCLEVGQPKWQVHDKWPTLLRGFDQNAEEAPTLLENGGRLLSLMTSKQTQKMAVFMLGKAEGYAALTCFTFDLLMVKEALCACAQRDVTTEVYADKGHSLKGTTALQMIRLDEMRRAGVEVFLTDGPESSGIQHSKTLLVDGLRIVGSFNWSNSSRSNHEEGALIMLTAEGRRAAKERLTYLRKSSTLLTAELVCTAQETREARAARARAKSADTERYTTAKRFSVARARRMELASSEV
jgi:hypothetical protein